MVNLFVGKIKAVFLFFLLPSFLYCQSERYAITPSANYYSNANIIFYYDAGDLAVETINTTSLGFTQGFIQDLDSTAFLSIKRNSPGISFFAYPNPVYDIFIIKMQVMDLKNISVSLFDMFGREIRTEQKFSLFGEETNILIDLSGITAGNYIIRCEDRNSGHHEIIKLLKISR
jgi:hypothetical protein